MYFHFRLSQQNEEAITFPISDTWQTVSSLFLFKFLLFAVTINTGGKPERPDILYGTTGHMERPHIWNDRTYGTVGKIE